MAQNEFCLVMKPQIPANRKQTYWNSPFLGHSAMGQCRSNTQDSSVTSLSAQEIERGQ
jgi:hypothetical protein